MIWNCPRVDGLETDTYLDTSDCRLGEETHRGKCRSRSHGCCDKRRTVHRSRGCWSHTHRDLWKRSVAKSSVIKCVQEGKKDGWRAKKETKSANWVKKKEKRIVGVMKRKSAKEWKEENNDHWNFKKLQHEQKKGKWLLALKIWKLIGKEGKNDAGIEKISAKWAKRRKKCFLAWKKQLKFAKWAEKKEGCLLAWS